MKAYKIDTTPIAPSKRSMDVSRALFQQASPKDGDGKPIPFNEEAARSQLAISVSNLIYDVLQANRGPNNTTEDIRRRAKIMRLIENIADDTQGLILSEESYDALMKIISDFRFGGASIELDEALSRIFDAKLVEVDEKPVADVKEAS